MAGQSAPSVASVLSVLLLAISLAPASAADPSPTTIAVVQISFWMTVILVVVLAAVITNIGGMNYQSDTLLFQKSKDD